MSRCASYFGVLCLLGGAGCGADGLPTAPVAATVLLDGSPVTQGVVLFTPEQGRQARGEIQSDGRVVLGTRDESDGAVIGKHRVAISAAVEDPTRKSDGRLTAVKWLIPPRYGATATSGLTFDVKEGGHQLRIELSSKGPGRIVEK